MSTELLKPRVKIINDWPGVAGRVVPGQIYPLGNCDSFWIDGEPFLEDKIKDYPYLFKLLEWYEEREVSEMPEYLKSLSGVVFKMQPWDGKVNFKGTPLMSKDQYYSYMDVLRVNDFLPATKQEFEAYQNQTTQP